MMIYLLAILYFLLPYIHAIPLTSRTVYDPPITSPDGKTIWNVGGMESVTWDISSLPSNLTNTGMLILGYEANNSENLMLDNPLASGFLLTDGKIQITVPDVPSRSNYIVVLFGDSGNASPQFTITNGGSSVSSTTNMPASPSGSSVAASDPSSAIVPVAQSTTTISPFLSPPTSSLATPTSTITPLTATPTQAPANANAALTRQLDSRVVLLGLVSAILVETF